MAWLVSGERVIASVEVLDRAADRMRGLLGRDTLDGAVMLRPARSVHTIGMKFPIDVVYCRARSADEHGDGHARHDGEFEILSIATMAPHRLGRPRLRSEVIIELPAGHCDRENLAVGDIVEIRLPDDPGAMLG